MRSCVATSRCSPQDLGLVPGLGLGRRRRRGAVVPSLLPAFGGKGMYGMHVHRAIYNNKEEETGISIHYVNEHYDEGGLIFQQKVN